MVQYNASCKPVPDKAQAIRVVGAYVYIIRINVQSLYFTIRTASARNGKTIYHCRKWKVLIRCPSWTDDHQPFISEGEKGILYLASVYQYSVTIAAGINSCLDRIELGNSRRVVTYRADRSIGKQTYQ